MILNYKQQQNGGIVEDVVWEQREPIIIKIDTDDADDGNNGGDDNSNKNNTINYNPGNNISISQYFSHLSSLQNRYMYTQYDEFIYSILNDDISGQYQESLCLEIPSNIIYKQQIENMRKLPIGSVIYQMFPINNTSTNDLISYGPYLLRYLGKNFSSIKSMNNLIAGSANDILYQFDGNFYDYTLAGTDQYDLINYSAKFNPRHSNIQGNIINTQKNNFQLENDFCILNKIKTDLDYSGSYTKEQLFQLNNYCQQLWYLQSNNDLYTLTPVKSINNYFCDYYTQYIEGNYNSESGYNVYLIKDGESKVISKDCWWLLCLIITEQSKGNNRDQIMINQYMLELQQIQQKIIQINGDIQHDHINTNLTDTEQKRNSLFGLDPIVTGQNIYPNIGNFNYQNVQDIQSVASYNGDDLSIQGADQNSYFQPGIELFRQQNQEATTLLYYGNKSKYTIVDECVLLGGLWLQKDTSNHADSYLLTIKQNTQKTGQNGDVWQLYYQAWNNICYNNNPNIDFSNKFILCDQSTTKNLLCGISPPQSDTTSENFQIKSKGINVSQQLGYELIYPKTTDENNLSLQIIQQILVYQYLNEFFVNYQPGCSYSQLTQNKQIKYYQNNDLQNPKQMQDKTIFDEKNNKIQITQDSVIIGESKESYLKFEDRNNQIQNWKMKLCHGNQKIDKSLYILDTQNCYQQVYMYVIDSYNTQNQYEQNQYTYLYKSDIYDTKLNIYYQIILNDNTYINGLVFLKNDQYKLYIPEKQIQLDTTSIVLKDQNVYLNIYKNNNLIQSSVKFHTSSQNITLPQKYIKMSTQENQLLQSPTFSISQSYFNDCQNTILNDGFLRNYSYSQPQLENDFSISLPIAGIYKCPPWQYAYSNKISFSTYVLVENELGKSVSCQNNSENNNGIKCINGLKYQLQTFPNSSSLGQTRYTAKTLNNTVYLFGYPINLLDPNGIYLLKLSQIRFPMNTMVSDTLLSMEYPFKGSVQFAKIFCLIYGSLLFFKPNSTSTNIIQQYVYQTQLPNYKTMEKNSSYYELSNYMLIDVFTQYIIKYYIVQQYGTIDGTEQTQDSKGNKYQQYLYKFNETFINKLYKSGNISEEQIKKITQIKSTSIRKLALFLQAFGKNTATYLNELTIKMIQQLITISDNINQLYLNQATNLKQYGFVIPGNVVQYYTQSQFIMAQNEFQNNLQQNISASDNNVFQSNVILVSANNGGQLSNINIEQTNINNITQETNINIDEINLQEDQDEQQPEALKNQDVISYIQGMIAVFQIQQQLGQLQPYTNGSTTYNFNYYISRYTETTTNTDGIQQIQKIQYYKPITDISQLQYSYEKSDTVIYPIIISITTSDKKLFYQIAQQTFAYTDQKFDLNEQGIIQIEL